jgi:hypothetical protein
MDKTGEKSKRHLKYTLIDSISECIRTVEEVLLKERIMALDCEGVFLSKEGRLTLIQVIKNNLCQTLSKFRSVY